MFKIILNIAGCQKRQWIFIIPCEILIHQLQYNVRPLIQLMMIPCLPTISATCSELGTGTHSVMLALFLPLDVIADALISDRMPLTTPPAVVATIGARLSTGDAFPPPPQDDDGDNDVGIAPLEAVTTDVPLSVATPMFRLEANLARSSAS